MITDLELLSEKPLGNKHIIFIHGLGGHYKKTWCKRDSKDELWLPWLCEDNENINIWSVGYEAPKFTIFETNLGIPDLAVSIFQALISREELLEGELIFVGHSLGGLIIKKILHLADGQKHKPETPEIQEFIQRVSGIVFLATPHQGSDLATLGSNLLMRFILRLFWQQISTITTSLSREDTNLRELHDWYSKDFVKNKDIRHLILRESKRLWGMNIVPISSADPGLESRPIPMAADHVNICKPINKKDPIYHNIQYFIAKIIKKKINKIWLATKFLKSSSWKGYENWAYCPNGIEEEYIIDEEVRLFNSRSKNNQGYSGIGILNIMRECLSKQYSANRLIGLSGVGKTRFVQALFDSRIGKNALPIETVLYTDISHSPFPTPIELAEKLISENRQAHLIIDNCPPDLHQKLATICTVNNSKVNLLTIEYDVREDQAEHTDVFSLEPAPVKLIEKMLISRSNNISQQNARMIADFSGGNALVASALADTIKKDGHISRLKNEDLFQRLFWQRNEEDSKLEEAAGFLSLAYSFQAKSKNEANPDLLLLSELSELSTLALYKYAKELKRRNLIQQRDIWMAVLPHPIANRLAKNTLENIPNYIINKIYQKSDERFIKSFSKRLGYLNDSEKAKEIAKQLLNKCGRNNKFTWVLVKNIAPIIPNETLEYIEQYADNDQKKIFLTRKNEHYLEITRLLRSLAYTPELFPQCTNLLCEFAISEKENENNNSIRSLLEVLFQPYFSGTHATKEQRLGVIRGLLASQCRLKQNLAFNLLDTTLKTRNFSSYYEFDFGVQSRDYGYYPKNSTEIQAWYKEFVNFIASLIIPNYPLIPNNSFPTKAKLIFGHKLRELWRYPSIRNLIEQNSKIIREQGEWNEGWLAVKSILRFDITKITTEERERLINLEKLLASKTLEEQVKLYVLLPDNHCFSELDEFDEQGKVQKHGYRVAENYAENLGFNIASSDYDYLLNLLPELLSLKNENHRLFSFGKGCAKGAHSPEELWLSTLSMIEINLKSNRNMAFLRGLSTWLNKNEYSLSEKLLDDLLVHSQLKLFFPRIQLNIPLNARSIERIKQSLQEGESPISMYQPLTYKEELILDNKLCEILELIWEKPNGQKLVIDILSNKLQEQKNNKIDKKCIKKLHKFLFSVDFSEKQYDHQRDYNLSIIANVCFSEPSSYELAKLLLDKLVNNILNYRNSLFEIEYFISAIIKLHPVAMLESFIGDKTEVEYRLKDIFLNSELDETYHLMLENIAILLEWCAQKPTQRFPALASLIKPYNTVDGKCDWNQLAYRIVENCPEPIKVLNEFIILLEPKTWEGSYAEALKAKLPWFKVLKEHKNVQISEWAKEQEKEWYKLIKKGKEIDKKMYKKYERFEH